MKRPTPKRLEALPSATRVVATLGPASSQPSVMRQMILSGTDVFRFNMSHGTVAEHRKHIAEVRRVAAELHRPIGILVDLQGPKLRTARNEGGVRIPLPRGRHLEVVGRGVRSSATRIVVQFPRIVETLEDGDSILLDDGALVLRVTGKRPREGVLEVTVVRGGSLKERAGVNLPGRPLPVRVPTKQDLGHARMAVEAGADFVALSFVQQPEEIVRLRRVLTRLASELPHARPPLIVAKIEKPAALENLDAILAVTDGVMVARGDLGVETALEKVPVWQKEILRRCQQRGIFAITATQMLESMIESAVPTRAEVSDVANAVFDGTDALMLSAESATGKYPVESVRMLTRIAREVERGLPARSAASDAFLSGPPSGHRFAHTAQVEAIEAMVEATLALATRAEARCIVCFTLTGRTGFLLARHRPRMGIVCLTPEETTRQRLTAAWNVRSILLPRVRTADEMMRRGLELLKAAKVVRSGDTVVLVGGAANVPEATNLLRWVRV